ncbi:MAG: DUF502 domain-containing protein [Dehalococcoidia bacterium]
MSQFRDRLPIRRIRDQVLASVPNFQRYLVAGLLALIPLWVTWVALSFVFNWLTGFGRPLVRAFAGIVGEFAPRLASILLQPWFGSLLAFLIVVAGLYVLGRATTNVIGRQGLAYVEGILARIPLVSTIYNATKSLITAFEVQPAGVQRVVLIDFPSREMKAVGFVTRTVRDENTGGELAMVYVPTTPNPTSGYMEVVPVSRLTPTDWTIEEAMRFVMTGGTSGPDHINFGEDRGETPR